MLVEQRQRGARHPHREVAQGLIQLRQALAHYQGDPAKVAETLDVPLRTLQRRLKAAGLASGGFWE